MNGEIKRVTINELPSSSTINDEDVFIKSNSTNTSKITAKTIANYINSNLDTQVNVQSDWNETNVSSDAYIKNKPTSMTANGGNADTVNGHTVESDVPAGAEFTDTIYIHPDSGIAAGTYRSVTVDEQGHVTNGSNPTTLSEYGITDAATDTQGEKADTAVQSVKIGTTEYKSGTTVILPDYPTALPASDVYEWAKSETKPVYTASEVGADALGAADTALSSSKEYTDSRITQLIGTSPENLDTIEELGTAISENQSAIDAIENAITNKADTDHNHDELYATKSSEHAHENQLVLDTITSEKILSWDSKSDFDGNYNSLVNTPAIPSSLSQLTNDAGYITANDIDTSQNHTHNNKDALDTITQTLVNNWNAAKGHSDSEHAPTDAEKNQNAFSNVIVDSTTISANNTTDTLTLVAGSNVTITVDEENKIITIASTNTNYSPGAGISLSGTTFSNSGVRSISSGSSNGTIRVDTNGTATDVAVKGLGSASYINIIYATVEPTTVPDNTIVAVYEE